MFKTRVILALSIYYATFQFASATPPPLLPDTCSDRVCIKRGYKKENGKYVDTVSKSIHSDKNSVRFLFNYANNSHELISLTFPDNLERFFSKSERSIYFTQLLKDEKSPTLRICEIEAMDRECIFLSTWSYANSITEGPEICPFQSLWISPTLVTPSFPTGRLLIEGRIKQGVCNYSAEVIR